MNSEDIKGELKPFDTGDSDKPVSVNKGFMSPNKIGNMHRSLCSLPDFAMLATCAINFYFNSDGELLVVTIVAEGFNCLFLNDYLHYGDVVVGILGSYFSTAVLKTELILMGV